MSDLIFRQDHDGVATLTLNRPDKLNALSKSVFEALEEHVDDLARATKTVGLVVLRGGRGNFSAGYEMSEVYEYTKSHTKPHYHSEVINKLANLPQPVVSAVEGYCSAGALELALAADLIVARVSTIFRCLRPLGADSSLGPHAPPAASYRHRQGERDDAHLAHLLRPGRSSHAPREFLLR